MDRSAMIEKSLSQSWLTVLAILLLTLSSLSARAEPQPKNVLVIFSAFERERETLDLMKSGLLGHFPGPVNVSVVYLDYQRLEQQSYRKSLAGTLHAGYAD